MPELPALHMHRRGLLTAFGLSALALSACSAEESGTKSGKVAWAAWSGEIDPEDIKRLEADTGLTVDYREAVSDAEQFLASIRPQLEAGLSTGWDLVCLSGSLLPLALENDWLVKLNQDNIPNVEANIVPGLASVTGLEYAVPFDYAPLGLAYNKKGFPDGVASWADLLDPALKGKVSLYSTFIPNISAWAIHLKSEGKIDNDPDALTVEEALEVIGFLEPHIASGHFRTSQGENYTQQLANGDISVAIAAPVNVAGLDQSKVGFSIPTEGAPAYVDRLAILKGSENAAGAEEVINWWYEPENAAAFCAWTLQYPYAQGVQDVLAKSDPELADDPNIFPGEEALASLRPYPAPWNEAVRTEVADAWAQATGL